MAGSSLQRLAIAVKLSNMHLAAVEDVHLKRDDLYEYTARLIVH